MCVCVKGLCVFYLSVLQRCVVLFYTSDSNDTNSSSRMGGRALLLRCRVPCGEPEQMSTGDTSIPSITLPPDSESETVNVSIWFAFKRSAICTRGEGGSC